MTTTGATPEREVLPSGGYQYGRSRPELRPRVPGGQPVPAAPPHELAAAPGAAPELPITRVQPHPGNVRQDLGDLSEMAASIRAHGILQPIAVEPHPRLAGHWQVVAGHRRLAAAKLAGLTSVPVAIRKAGGAQPEELMLIENLHRADLNPMDKAEAMGALKAKGYSAVRIAKSTGLSDATVGFYLALLDLDKKSRARVRDGSLPAADAVAAVRRVRKRNRAREGRPEMAPHWEPDHFTSQHPLALRARALCDGREHSMRRRVGKLACGECWETVIRADERTVAAAMAGDAP